MLEDAAIAVDNGRIAAIGPRKNFTGYVAAKKLHLGSSLVLPGLVNAHTHVAMTFLRGVADDLPLMDWLNGHIFPREKHLTAELVYAGSLLGCSEMTRTGTTTFADMYLLEDAVAVAAGATGLRALEGEGIVMFPEPAYAPDCGSV